MFVRLTDDAVLMVFLAYLSPTSLAVPLETRTNTQSTCTVQDDGEDGDFTLVFSYVKSKNKVPRDKGM